MPIPPPLIDPDGNLVDVPGAPAPPQPWHNPPTAIGPPLWSPGGPTELGGGYGSYPYAGYAQAASDNGQTGGTNRGGRPGAANPGTPPAPPGPAATGQAESPAGGPARRPTPVSHGAGRGVAEPDASGRTSAGPDRPLHGPHQRPDRPLPGNQAQQLGA